MRDSIQELGGYIEFERFRGSEYHENAVALNSGRHCVEYIVRTKHIRKLYMPYFMCDSVSALCRRLNVDVDFYQINIDFTPAFKKELFDDEWMYIVNFYGQLSDKQLLLLKEKYGRIIVDNAQAFFQKPINGVDTCYTCRKFFGVADGAYLYTDTFLAEELPIDYSYDKMEFLMGRFEKTASEFYSHNVENNNRFANEPLMKMSKLTHNLLRGIDYEFVKQRRTENYTYLHDKFGKYNKLQLSIPDGAFMYPLYVENGAVIRKKLQAEKIYIPTLWPDVFDVCRENELEYDMAMNILPLPVDQRYTIKEMDVIYILTSMNM